jgi:hypothetical protein
MLQACPQLNLNSVVIPGLEAFIPGSVAADKMNTPVPVRLWTANIIIASERPRGAEQILLLPIQPKQSVYSVQI